MIARLESGTGGLATPWNPHSVLASAPDARQMWLSGFLSDYELVSPTLIDYRHLSAEFSRMRKSDFSVTAATWAPV